MSKDEELSIDHDRRDTLRKVLVIAGFAVSLPQQYRCAPERQQDPAPANPEAELELIDFPAKFRYLEGFTLKIKWRSNNVQNVVMEYKAVSDPLWSLVYSGSATVFEHCWRINFNEGEYEFRVLKMGSNQVLESKAISFEKLQGFPLLISTVPSLSTNGGTAVVVTFELGRLAIRRITNTHFLVLSAQCTHAGCTIEPNPAEEGWNCNCHGSAFDKLGQVTNGPAEDPLPCFISEFFPNEDILLIV
jgi:nitrite reductase/ring-hydroxylating ferredoxin subunit